MKRIALASITTLSLEAARLGYFEQRSIHIKGFGKFFSGFRGE